METKAKKKISKDNVLIFFLKNRALLLVLIFFILLSVATDTFLTSSNMVSLARQIAANGIIGVGYTFLLASDSVDLSAGYMMCMIGIISGLLSQTGMPFICILILCAVIAVICSSFNAVIENKFNLPPFLVTLAMQQVFRGILMLLSNGSPISNLNEGIIYMGQGYIGPIPFSVLLMLVFIVIGHIIFSRTQFGRNVIAVGGNPEAARVSGIDVNSCICQRTARLHDCNHGTCFLRPNCKCSDHSGWRYRYGYHCSCCYWRHSYGRWFRHGCRYTLWLFGYRSHQQWSEPAEGIQLLADGLQGCHYPRRCYSGRLQRAYL